MKDDARGLRGEGGCLRFPSCSVCINYLVGRRILLQVACTVDISALFPWKSISTRTWTTMKFLA